MDISEISKIVANELQGVSRLYLQDIVWHGIHCLTNDFNGGSDDDYQRFSDEFELQAKALLEEI